MTTPLSNHSTLVHNNQPNKQTTGFHLRRIPINISRYLFRICVVQSGSGGMGSLGMWDGVVVDDR